MIVDEIGEIREQERQGEMREMRGTRCENLKQVFPFPLS
jgi:hypothetical protein